MFRPQKSQKYSYEKIFSEMQYIRLKNIQKHY